MRLRKRELQDSGHLFDLIQHPDIFPYVREKANSLEEYIFTLKHIINLEETGEVISRVILNEYGQIIGTINLFDVSNKSGFLGTWLGKDYHGLGYNNIAKEYFFLELFEEQDIENIFMKVRKTNIRSTRAVEKIPYVFKINTYFPEVYNQINENGEVYDLYLVEKDLFYSYLNRNNNELDNYVLEA